MLKHLWNTLKICLFGQSTEQLLSKLVWNTVRDFITFFSFVRFCMKFNTFFTLVKLYFSKITLTSFNHSHKKRIVWKHGPNRPFYALMLRTKLY